MKPLSALNAGDLANIKMVSFDVDGVLVEKGTEVFEMEDSEKSNVLIIKTKRIHPELVAKINLLKKHLMINISSGRSLLYLIETFDPIMWENVSLQGENGLFTLMAGKMLQNAHLYYEELEILRNIRKEIYKLMKTNPNIRGFEPKQFLISIHCFKEEPAIENIVKKIDIENTMGIKWSSEAYNIFPNRISKATGIQALTRFVGMELSQVLVVGNDPNDKEAVDGPGISVTTSPATLIADYYTESKLDLGGEELVDRLLEIFG